MSTHNNTGSCKTQWNVYWKIRLKAILSSVPFHTANSYSSILLLLKLWSSKFRKVPNQSNRHLISQMGQKYSVVQHPLTNTKWHNRMVGRMTMIGILSNKIICCLKTSVEIYYTLTPSIHLLDCKRLKQTIQYKALSTHRVSKTVRGFKHY